MKLKKSPSLYVFAHKNCFIRRLIMLFVSAGTHDHEEVFTNLSHHCHGSKNFLRHTNSSEVSRKIVTFCIILNNLCSGSGLKWYETEKIIVCLLLCKWKLFQVSCDHVVCFWKYLRSWTSVYKLIISLSQLSKSFYGVQSHQMSLTK